MGSKEDINKSLRTGEYTVLQKPQSNATWWKNFNRIKDKDDKIISYVQCVKCKNLFAYQPKNTDPSTLKNHVSSCKITPDSPTYTIENIRIGFMLYFVGSGRIYLKFPRIGSGSDRSLSGRIGLGFKYNCRVGCGYEKFNPRRTLMDFYGIL